jgi:hypothetical protein
MSYETLTNKHLNNLRERIRGRIAVNSGEAAESLEVRGNQLLGNDYIYFLDQGRGPGKFPPPTNIVAWVRSQLGLEGREAKQVAFLIGRKISQEGTAIYKDKSKGLRLDELIEEMLDELTKELPEEVAVEALKWL